MFPNANDAIRFAETVVGHTSYVYMNLTGTFFVSTKPNLSATIIATIEWLPRVTMR
jgi:hypothetical protein